MSEKLWESLGPSLFIVCGRWPINPRREIKLETAIEKFGPSFSIHGHSFEEQCAALALGCWSYLHNVTTMHLRFIVRRMLVERKPFYASALPLLVLHCLFLWTWQHVTHSYLPMTYQPFEDLPSIRRVCSSPGPKARCASENTNRMINWALQIWTLKCLLHKSERIKDHLHGHMNTWKQFNCSNDWIAQVLTDSI